MEVGVRLVLSRKRVAVLGGRETLYYDTERFGEYKDFEKKNLKVNLKAG